MNKILERIKKLETFSNKKQQWNIIKDIEGKTQEISEKKQEDIDDLKERVQTTPNKNANKVYAEWRNGNVVIIKENDER